MAEHDDLDGIDGIDDRLDRIALGLARLRELDPPQPERSHFVINGRRQDGYVMFGADDHQYRSEPLSEERIAAVEVKMSCAFPKAFRAYLGRIGVGAGPYYGVDWRLIDRSAGTRCAQPVPEADGGPYELDEGSEAELECGYVVLSHLGCGDFVGLATAGHARGRVVFLLRNRNEWNLGPAFLDYIEQWLERGIVELSADPRPTAITAAGPYW